MRYLIVISFVVFLLPVKLYAQTLNVKGQVSDSEGKGLQGVSIQVKGTSIKIATDFLGSYELQNVPVESTLIFSHLGYETQEVNVAEEILNVTLKDEASAIEDVVVIGYGAVDKKDLTGSVSQVNMEDLSKAPVASFDQALAGRVAGVDVSSQEDGQPGSGMNIVIRGVGSLTQSTSPLYVIDGMPIEDPSNSALNPDDIESINVLKDASATAIYGARGANGVIVIETKKGKLGKPRMSFRSSMGFDQVAKTMEMMSPFEFVTYELERDPLLDTVYLADDRTMDFYRDAAPIDWQDRVFKTGQTNIHSLSIRGGNGGTRYSVSGSFFDNKAVVINTGYQRYQGRLNLDQDLGKKVKSGININYTHQKTWGQTVGRTAATSSTSISGYLLYSVWGYRPIVGNNTENYDLDLEDEIVDPDVEGDFRINPVVNAENTLREVNIDILSANTYLTYDIRDDLQLKITGAANGRIGRNDQFYNKRTIRGTPLRSNNVNGVTGSVNYTQRLDWVNENTLTWKKQLNGVHRLNIVGGFSVSGRNTSGYGFSAVEIPNEELGINGLEHGTPLETNSAAGYHTMASFMSRINYNYRSKYYFTGTMRADGSSKFPTTNKWGYFPSGAVSWRMEREDFMKDLSFISEAKIRLSYGITGNNRVGDFAYLPGIDFPDLASYSFGNERILGMVIPSLGNDQLRWESSKQWDVGYDLGLFNDKISLTIDAYRKTTDDLLLRANLPYTTGFPSEFMNIGRLQNQGLEITLNTVNVKKENFAWETNFNISFNRNKVLALTEGESTLFSRISSYATRMAEEPMYVAEVGKPASMFYGLIWDGVYQYEDFNEIADGQYKLKDHIPTNGDVRETIQPGDIKYKDINEDGVVDANDRTIIGNPMPKHTGGFSNRFSYKGVGLNILLQWSYGGQLLNANRIIFEGNATNVLRFNQFASYNDRWTPENPSNTLFRAGGQGPQVVSSRTIEDGSYLRLKTLSLDYMIPTELTQRIGVSSLNLSVQVQNLLTWTKYSGMDPEVSVHRSVLTPGFDFSAYPHARRVTFGLRMML